jgi:hypothetical protein
MVEAIVIILALGGLEGLLWWIGQKEAKKQTELLEDIAISLSLREMEKDIESSGHD